MSRPAPLQIPNIGDESLAAANLLSVGLDHGLTGALPKPDSYDLYRGEKVGSEFFVAGCETPELFELVEGAFAVGDDRDGIACSIGSRIHSAS